MDYSQLFYRYSKISQFKNKVLRRNLYQMSIYDFNKFLITEVEPNMRTQVQKIRRKEQVKINVRNYRKTYSTEVNNLEEQKSKLVEERENLKREIEIYSSCTF